MEAFLPFAQTLARQSHPIVMGGDWNVAHTEDDIQKYVDAFGEFCQELSS